VEPRVGARPSSLVVAEDQVIPAQCEGLVMAGLESPLGVENGLVEPSLEAHMPEGLHSQDPGPRPPESTFEGPECCPLRPEAHERILLAHCEPVTQVTPTQC
jgi:hypothetical protein